MICLFRSNQNALKQRLGQNRWLLPLCWCSPDYTIRIVYHYPKYVIQKHHFPPHLLTFNGVIYISDYIIQSFYRISGLCNPKPFIQKVAPTFIRVIEVSKTTNLSEIYISKAVRILYSRPRVFLKINRAREDSHKVGKVNLKNKLK